MSLGYLQTPCTRYVLGGPQKVANVKTYIGFYTRRFGINSTEEAMIKTLRNANDCLIFNANNLLLSVGNIFYGGLTWVLNPQAMRDRLMFEAWDAGITESQYLKLEPPVYPGLGTFEDWLHLIQPHEELWNLPIPDSFGPNASSLPCCNYSIAYLLNRWAVHDYPEPNASTGGTIFMEGAPYFEVMTMGNAYLPEDLLYAGAPFADVTGISGSYPGLWGTPDADTLREFCTRSKRPLLWNLALDQEGLPNTLIDPVVGGIAGGRITDTDRALFANWTRKDVAGFIALAAASPKYLHFYPLRYTDRHVCAKAERSSANQVMGTDGDGNCVYWIDDARSSGGWELLNDGTCVTGTARGHYHTKAACKAAGSRWTCRRNITDAYIPDAHYCVPAPKGEFSGIEACETACQ
eukprot:Hpha_TRINITY_DN16802_c1_g1::TRINITY_DN16802_c1_g1_i4::g.151064::m.151064